MKELVQSLQETIARGVLAQAVAIFEAGLALNADAFVDSLRKEGVLRFSRYNYRTKPLLPLVEEIIGKPGLVLGRSGLTYLYSVVALGRVAPEIRGLFREVEAAINPRSFKTYLVTIERLFREHHRPPERTTIEQVQSSWRDFQKEDLADAFSYYFSILLKGREPDIEELNQIVPGKLTSDYYLEQLAKLAKIIHRCPSELRFW